MDYLTTVRDRARSLSQQLFGDNGFGFTPSDVSFASTGHLRSETLDSFNNVLSRIKSSASGLLDQIQSDGQKKIEDAKAFLFSKNYTQVQSSENKHSRYSSCVNNDIENFTAGKPEGSKSFSASERREKFSKFHEVVLNDYNVKSFNSKSQFMKNTSKGTLNIFPPNIQQINICKTDTAEHTVGNSTQNYFSRHEQPDFLPFCEEYDGLDMRKTNTISESMQAFLKKGDKICNMDFQKDSSLKRCGKPKDDRKIKAMGCAFNSERETYILKDEKYRIETVISNVKTIPANSSNEEPLEQDIQVSNQNNYPTINARVQFLIMSKKLKVTIRGLENMPNKDDNLKNTFVEVNLEIGKRHITKRAKRTGNKDTLNFSKAIYFSNIDLKGAHMSCIRFRLCKKVAVFKLKRCICLGESLVYLDNLDIVGSVSVSGKVDKNRKKV